MSDKEQLRAALIACIRNMGGGATDDVSDEFLLHAPEECGILYRQRNRLRTENARLRGIREKESELSAERARSWKLAEQLAEERKQNLSLANENKRLMGICSIFRNEQSSYRPPTVERIWE